MPGEPSAADRSAKPVVLVVDDDPGLRESFRVLLEDWYEVLDVPDGPQALEVLRACHVDVVLLDVRLPEMDGLEVLERIRTVDEQADVIMVTAVTAVRTAVTAMKLGAVDYITKPFEEEEVLAVIRRAIERRALEREVAFLRSELARRDEQDALVGKSREMRALHALIARVAETASTVLITGESGVGKELVARAIHRQGPRRDRPFVTVNLAATSETLLESELFGHERGAFTGAYQRKLGKFELAQGGTIFLDEVAALKPELQAKLLRVLQEREIERVGGTRAIPVGARVIAATNVDLRRAIASGSFRDDLFYRLNVIPIPVPPLRERREDIPLLVDHFLQRYSREFNKRVQGIAPEALAALQEYRWPGNVRELQNMLERLVVLLDAPWIQLRDLPLELMVPDQASRAQALDTLPLRRALARFERDVVVRVLERVRWNQSEAARLLGLHRNTLVAKLRRWKVHGPAGS
jgi:DNA-binding NtrC family response regulator